MKNVYVFGTRGFPNVQGGVEKHCEQLYPELTSKYNISIFRRIPFLKKNAEKVYKGIRFIDLPSTRIKGFEPFFHSFLCTIYCIIKRPDIVHIHNIVVLTYHSANYEHKKWNYISRKILKFSEWIAVNGSTAVIFVNKKQMCLFNDKIQRKSTYIPNGVYRKQPATRTDYIEKLGLQPQKYILAVGRITQEKGFDYLIDSYVQSLPHEISERAQKQNVIMPGYVDGEFLRQLYSHARLFVLPSYNEGFPLVLLEAMSYHLPILASDIPANKLLELNPGDYFKTGDALDLSKHIKQKLAQEFTRVDYPLDEYTWQNVSDKVTTIFDKI